MTTQFDDSMLNRLGTLSVMFMAALMAVATLQMLIQ